MKIRSYFFLTFLSVNVFALPVKQVNNQVIIGEQSKPLVTEIVFSQENKLLENTQDYGYQQEKNLNLDEFIKDVEKDDATSEIEALINDQNTIRPVGRIIK